MSARLEELAARKELVVARLQLQRMETTLRAAEMREVLRPASTIGSAIVKPAAFIGVLDLVAPLFGLRKVALMARVVAIALVAFRIARGWRGERAPEPETPLGD